MVRFSDFVASRKRFYNLSRGLCISALKRCRKMKFRIHLHLTLISKIFMLSQLSDFVVCSTGLYIWSSGVNIYGLEYNEKLKFSSSDHINTILNIADETSEGFLRKNLVAVSFYFLNCAIHPYSSLISFPIIEIIQA